VGTELLSQQHAFAQAYVFGHGNATQAAIEAGYSPVSARQTASRLLHTPHVQEAIQRAQAVTLRGRLATKALGVLEKVLDDENAPAGVRVDAAKTVLDRAGMAAFRGGQDLEQYEKPASEMTLAELDALAGVLERSLVVMRAECLSPKLPALSDG
jgi:phage terminase small subunit